MVNKINSAGEIASANAVSNNGPTPMRMEAARGQRAEPPLDSPSTLRLRASTSSQTTSAEPTAANRPAGAPSARNARPSSINPITLTAKVLTGTLALLAGQRVARYPGDFAKDPGGTLWAAVNLAQRTTPEHLQTGNHSVINRYGKHIPDNSHCFGAKADIAHNLPSNVQGRWQHDKAQVEISNNIQLETNPADVAAHEFIHCYTHPDFRARNMEHANWQAMNEGLTSHLTDKVQVEGKPWHFGKDAYHTFKLPSGKTWTEAAQQIEHKVGEDTLLGAFFGGNDAAIRKVSTAAAQVYPQVASQRTESQMWLAGNLRGSQHLAECYAGALLSAGEPLPNSWTRNMLPVFSFSDISHDKAQLMQQQAQQCKQRMGDVFEAAFFAPDLKTQKTALGMLREDLLMHWKPVL